MKGVAYEPQAKNNRCEDREDDFGVEREGHYYSAQDATTDFSRRFFQGVRSGSSHSAILISGPYG